MLLLFADPHVRGSNGKSPLGCGGLPGLGLTSRGRCRLKPVRGLSPKKEFSWLAVLIKPPGLHSFSLHTPTTSLPLSIPLLLSPDMSHRVPLDAVDRGEKDLSFESEADTNFSQAAATGSGMKTPGGVHEVG